MTIIKQKCDKVIAVALVKEGRMLNAAKDSYKQVHTADGICYYPTLARNKVKSKEELCLQPTEILGIKEGSGKDPIISLISAYCDTIIPDMERVVNELSDDGTTNVIFI